MEELDRDQIHDILKRFPSLDDLLENEVDKKLLGYKTLVVGSYDHWLSYDEYQNQEKSFFSQDETDLINRAKFIESFPSVFLYEYEEEKNENRLFNFDSRTFYDFVYESLKEQHIQTFVSINPDIVICTTPDLADLFYFVCEDDFDRVRMKVPEYNLKSFEDN